MTENGTRWFKGNLPNWIGALAVTFFCFVGVRFLNYATQKFDQVEESRINTQLQAARIVVLENTAIRLETGQQAVLRELQSINAAVRKQ